MGERLEEVLGRTRGIVEQSHVEVLVTASSKNIVDALGPVAAGAGAGGDRFRRTNTVLVLSGSPVLTATRLCGQARAPCTVWRTKYRSLLRARLFKGRARSAAEAVRLSMDTRPGNYRVPN